MRPAFGGVGQRAVGNKASGGCTELLVNRFSDLEVEGQGISMRHTIQVSFFASFLGVVLSAAGALAQDTTTPATPSQPLAVPVVRITAAPAETALTTLRGNTSPMAQSRYDHGTASASMATGRISLLLRRSPAQQQALTQYLGALQNPQSASYHKWLTPQSFGANFGIAQQDLQTVEQWLRSQGFKIENVPASLSSIQFSGTVGQVEQAFHTSIHSYVINGKQHYSNNADPQIPSALAPVVAGISQLNDFHPTPEHIMMGRQNAIQASHGAIQSTGGSQPQLTGTIGGSTTPFLFMTAADAATVYDAPNSLNRNYTGATSATGIAGNVGTGISIGLVGDSDLQTADYLNYRKLFLGEATPPQPTLVIDGVDPGVEDGDAAIEALLDAENAAALAPGANIYFYSSNDDLFESGAVDAAARAIQDNNVSILSISFGECEADLGASGNQQIADLWQQAAAQGITVLAAAGDSGSAGCDSDADASAQGGLAVSGYSSTPYDIAVGGTDFDTLVSNFDQYVSTTTQTNFYGTALSYIPENPWNDSISNNPPGAYTTNTASQYPTGPGTSTTILAAGGGGPSTSAICTSGDLDQNGNCISAITGAQLPLVGYPVPTFQSSNAFANTPLAGSTVRSTPDVALFASPGDQHQAGWALCSDNVTNADTSNGTYTDCVEFQPGSVADNASATYPVSIIGGTSASTPAFAGILAMVEQSVGHRLGLANQVLYNLAATNYSTVFHDVTAGNNSVPCVSGTPNCGTNGFLTGYNAGTSYDLASGLGSVDINALVNAWSAVTFTPTSVTLTANSGTGSVSITHGAAVTLASTVTPSSATGTVSITGPTSQAGAAVQEIIPLTNGTGSISTTALPGGSYSISAYYPGDATHAPSTSSTIPVTVAAEASSIAFQVSEYDLQSGGNEISTDPATAPYGEYGYAYAEPLNSAGSAADGPATGTMTLNNNGTAFSTSAFSSSQSLNSQGVAAFPLYDLAPAAYSFSAAYSGDNSYKSNTSTTVPLTIVKGATSLGISASSTSIAASTKLTVTVQLSTDSAGAFPTGSITLSANNTTFPATSVVDGTLNDGAVAELATFTIPGASLASGANTLTASYPGDTNYSAAANVSTTVTVSGSSTGAGFSIAGPAAGITVASVGGTGTGVITISPTGGFNGAVTLSCKFPVQIGGGVSPTCSVPSSVTIANNAATTATVTVSTSTGSAALSTDTPLHRLLFGGSGVALGALLLFGIPARRRSWRMMLVALFAVGLLGAVGCGSSSNSGNGGTSTGSYTLTITGTSGSTTVSTPISVVVN